MAASSYHVITKEVENHIFKHNLMFRDTCMYKQPTLTKYFRYTGRLFLGCALLLAHCSIIRASWETKKERLGHRKKYIKEFVRGTLLFWLYALRHIKEFVRGISLFWLYALLYLYIIFCCFLRLLFPLPKWRTCWIAPIKIHDNAMVGILCNDNMSERSKIWQSLAI